MNTDGKYTIDLAIEVASKAHRDQVRKGTDIPYITHIFSVAILLAQGSFSGEVIVAGILHDTVEDTSITLDFIREGFGDRVACIVRLCSESDKSLPWEERKSHTIDFPKTAPLQGKLVICAEKLHNIRMIKSEYERSANEVWTSFKRGREKQEWYYRSLVESLSTETHAKFNELFFQKLAMEVRCFICGDLIREITYQLKLPQLLSINSCYDFGIPTFKVFGSIPR